MSVRSLGKIAVTAAGTPEAATKNETNPTRRLICHSFLAEALPTNTGKVYVGRLGQLNKTTLAGVYAILPIPTTNVLPSFSVTLNTAYDSFDMSQVGIDADVNGEGVLVSIVQG